LFINYKLNITNLNYNIIDSKYSYRYLFYYYNLFLMKFDICAIFMLLVSKKFSRKIQRKRLNSNSDDYDLKLNSSDDAIVNL
jgi:hypothetical protein